MKTLFCFSAAAFILISQGAMAAPSCRGVYTRSEARESLIPSSGTGSASLSQAQRLLIALDSIPAEQKAALFKDMTPEKLSEIGRKLRTGQVPASLENQLRSNPGLELFYKDMAELSEAFPGLIGAANAETLVLRVLKAVVAQEALPHLNNPRLLESQSTAPRLRRTIDDSIENLIRQATYEYEGMKFERSGLNLLWYKIRRFISPSYRKVLNVAETGRFYQEQLERLRLVDAIAIRQLIGESSSLRLSDAELESATRIVLDSPKEIQDIEASLKGVFGEGFANGRAMEIGKFDLIKANQKAGDLPFEKIRDGFDNANIDALKSMNALINRSRQRTGERPRTESEFEVNELRLYFEAYHRRVGRGQDNYSAWTASASKENYTIEIQKTRQVEDGKDDQGQTKYRTETYYDTETVQPSFENILSGEFRRGDGSVSGLNEIISRAARVARSESVPRETVSQAETALAKILEGYNEAVLMGKNRDEHLQTMTVWIPKLETSIAAQKAYAQKTDAEILSQYSRDDVENFRARNQWMVKRLESLRDSMIMLKELMRRNQPQIEPSFDRQDFSGWMRELKEYRNRNYFFKAASTVAVMGTTGAYMAFERVPEFQAWVLKWAPQIAHLFQAVAN